MPMSNFLRGLVAVHQWAREANDEALRLFHQAIELDPEPTAAARCYVQRKGSGWVIDRAREIAEAKRPARTIDCS